MHSYLVTGSCGLIGAAIVAELLLRPGSFVYAAGRQVGLLRRQYGLHDGLKIVEYDATRPFLFDDCVDYVIHGASAASPELFTASPGETR